MNKKLVVHDDGVMEIYLSHMNLSNKKVAVKIFKSNCTSKDLIEAFIHDLFDQPLRYIGIFDQDDILIGVFGYSTANFDNSGCGIYWLNIRKDLQKMGIGTIILGLIIQYIIQYHPLYDYIIWTCRNELVKFYNGADIAYINENDNSTVMVYSLDKSRK